MPICFYYSFAALWHAVRQAREKSALVACHSSAICCLSSVIFCALWLSTLRFKAFHRFSVGFRSGEYGGKSKHWIPLSWSHFCTNLDQCFGSLSCRNHQCPLTKKQRADWMRCAFNIDFIRRASKTSVKMAILLTPLLQKQPHTDTRGGWATLWLIYS